MDFKRTKLLYGLISKNQSLSKKRHPMFEKSTFMKFFIYIFMAFWAVYLFFLGIALYAGFEESSREPYDMINGGMIFLLALDFYLRFGMQETPAQEIRPYKLLPIPQKFLLNVFLVRMALRPYNLFWHFLLVPIGFLSVPRFFGISGFVGFFTGWWLVFVVNSYWYLIWRTLVNKHVMFVSIPTVAECRLDFELHVLAHFTETVEETETNALDFRDFFFLGQFGIYAARLDDSIYIEQQD